MRHPLVALCCVLSLMGACGWLSDDDGSARLARERATKVRRAAGERAPRGRDVEGPHLIVLVVLDTLRADHTSLCGYDRPTTPYLEELASRPNVTYTCEGISPGSWTIPSHTSFFTGVSVREHGVTDVASALDDSVPVLAEELGARGYQTALVSANPTLSAESGLQRGFDVTAVARSLRDGRGDGLQQLLAGALRHLDARRPLFLVLNVIDDHDPYPEVPGKVGWLDAQPALVLDAHAEDRRSPFFDYVLGRFPDAAKARFLARLRDTYDWGIAESDRSLRASIGRLARGGWNDHGFRIAITSDHGEYLGEHDRLRHGCTASQPLVRVPVVLWASEGTPPPALPSPVSGLVVHHYLRTGALPDPLPPVEATSIGRPSADPRRCTTDLARWTSTTDKLVWRQGDVLRFDLAADPGELAPAAVSGAEADALRELAAGIREVKERAGRREEMRVLGYVE